MTNVKPSSVEGARDYFLGELNQVLERRQVKTSPGSVEYLAELVLENMKSDTFFSKASDGKLEDNVLANLYAEFVNGPSEAKPAALKRLGDVCLIVTGMFPDSLRHKLVDLDYYFGMGGAAYQQLANFQFTTLARGLYAELSSKFVDFSTVLTEMTERAGLQSNRDILRLYEKWLMTGNDRLKELLSEKGILTPIKIDTKTKH